MSSYQPMQQAVGVLSDSDILRSGGGDVKHSCMVAPNRPVTNWVEGHCRSNIGQAKCIVFSPIHLKHVSTNIEMI